MGPASPASTRSQVQIVSIHFDPPSLHASWLTHVYRYGTVYLRFTPTPSTEHKAQPIHAPRHKIMYYGSTGVGGITGQRIKSQASTIGIAWRFRGFAQRRRDRLPFGGARRLAGGSGDVRGKW